MRLPLAPTDACCSSSEPAEHTNPCCQATANACLPVAVIGAGPVGLAAAAHLIARGEQPMVFEAGAQVGASIREWSHVMLFSPWKYLLDETCSSLLDASGWQRPNGERLPSGGDFVSQYLEPLAALPAIAPHVHLSTRVLKVTRRGYDKVKSAGRSEAPFELVVTRAGGPPERVLARAVIDASGTWLSPNPMGAGGVPADGEAANAAHIAYRIPDVRHRERSRYVGKRTLVVGSGHSAFNVLLDLAAVRESDAESADRTSITWAVRRDNPGQMFGGGTQDDLEARGALGLKLRRLVRRGEVQLHFATRITRVVGQPAPSGTELQVITDTGETLGPFDEIVVATGFRPDLDMTRELRLGLDASLEAPVVLAPLIDPNLHSCGSVPPHGAAELAHPEQDYFVVGMKSYGRAPTFLLLTGYEQVRSVVCALVGDDEGARNVHLVLPETGVCSTDLGGSCCEPVAQLVGLSSGRGP